MKVSELEGAQLDYWAGCAVGKKVVFDQFGITYAKAHFLSKEPTCWSPSKFWEQGGPIIEREKICLEHDGCYALIDGDRDGLTFREEGPTILVAAMRAFVARKYGETVPDKDE